MVEALTGWVPPSKRRETNKAGKKTTALKVPYTEDEYVKAPTRVFPDLG